MTNRFKKSLENLLADFFSPMGTYRLRVVSSDAEAELYYSLERKGWLNDYGRVCHEELEGNCSKLFVEIGWYQIDTYEDFDVASQELLKRKQEKEKQSETTVRCIY